MSFSAFQVGDLLDGRYQLLVELGSGGSAVVFRAEDLQTETEVAVKVLTVAGEAREEFSRRLRVEARAMAAVAHPNVLRVLRIGEVDGHDYIVTELAAGTLWGAIKSQGATPLQVVDWMIQVLSGLAVAHDRGIVHRDVKPQNVLLAEDGRALLADFGIALVDEGTRHTRHGTTLGSVAYMPPEQRRDSRLVDSRADIYAVGATLFRLLTATTPVDLFLDAAASERLAVLPPSLRAVVWRATRQHPDQRYPDARSMAAALQALRVQLDPEATLPVGLLDGAVTDVATGIALGWLGPDFETAPTWTLPPPAVAPPPAPDASPLPPVPDDEQDRLMALLATAILDTEVEERFERHTRLAQRLFDVPVALVSLIDADRQWLKSHRGLDEREFRRNEAFCAHTIAHANTLMEVPDATSDPRFRDNPFVLADPGIRFYAGMPLRGPDQQPLGSLCIVDHKARHLDATEQALLADLAAMVEEELARESQGTIDPLTGLSNKVGFSRHALRALGMARHRGTPITLLHLQLPERAESQSPAALAAFANLLREVFSAALLLARIAPEAFAVMVADRAEADAGLVRLRARAPHVRCAVVTTHAEDVESLAVLMGRAQLAADAASQVQPGL